jgi:hypothetical protein
MTMRYAHLAPEHNQAAVDRLVSSAVSSGQVVAKSVTGKTGSKSSRGKKFKTKNAKVAELADAPDLGSGG